MHRVLLAVAMICFFVGISQADIFGLGDLTGGDFSSKAIGVSSNGTFVVGQSSSVIGPEAFVWSQSGGMVGLGFLPNDEGSRAFAVSKSGLVVVGYCCCSTFALDWEFAETDIERF